MRRYRLSTLLLLIIVVGVAEVWLIQYRRAGRREAEMRARLAEEKARAARSLQPTRTFQYIYREWLHK
jgi:hypothetical protein